ncbi:hypothetical protein GGI15_004717 [Coemansia interrupta]|uniref:Nudix hydrolase domain-containing protein n=1 Tax=Coemansia interrupta TaxID=1126814 RepID=A0A9W8H7P0_9FUNG|nr:hypothetical protein GGI15_004717 [Coemansia interrupta]
MHAPRVSASLIITAPLAASLATPASSNYRVLMVKRVAHGAFAHALVFPGGTQEPQDSGPLCCALRETLEETGLHLPNIPAQPLGRWLTPRAQPRRFDTRFFLLTIGHTHREALQQLDRARPQMGELEDVRWVRPAEVLAWNRRGEMPLFPPQFCVLLEMSRVARWQELADGLRHLDAGRAVEPVLCQRSDGRVVAVMPGDWAYPVVGPDDPMRVADGHLFGEAGALNRLVMERAAAGGFNNIRLLRTAAGRPGALD